MSRFGARAGSRLWQEEGGSGLVESAVSAVLLLMVVFGIIDGVRALYADHFVSNVAREATRYAMVRGATWAGSPCNTTQAYACSATTANITQFVTALVPAGLDPTNLTVSATWPGTTPTGGSCTQGATNNAPGCTVMVKTTYSFNFLLPFLPKNTVNLSSASSVVIAQ